MTSKNLTVSIPIEQDLFLTENPSLSPSKILQSAITQIEENRKDLKGEITRLANDKIQLLKFIHSKNLWEEFQAWKLKT